MQVDEDTVYHILDDAYLKGGTYQQLFDLARSVADVNVATAAMKLVKELKDSFKSTRSNSPRQRGLFTSKKTVLSGRTGRIQHAENERRARTASHRTRARSRPFSLVVNPPVEPEPMAAEPEEPPPPPLPVTPPRRNASLRGSRATVLSSVPIPSMSLSSTITAAIPYRDQVRAQKQQVLANDPSSYNAHFRQLYDYTTQYNALRKQQGKKPIELPSHAELSQLVQRRFDKVHERAIRRAPKLTFTSAHVNIRRPGGRRYTRRGRTYSRGKGRRRSYSRVSYGRRGYGRRRVVRRRRTFRRRGMRRTYRRRRY